VDRERIAKYWQREDVEFLLAKVLDGERILVAGTELGIPTIHGIKGADHCGYGVFKAVTPEYDVTFCAGGAMSRTPFGAAWTALSVRRGSYPYDSDAVAARLQEILDEDPWTHE
jgi:hypothetical protein